MDPEKHLRDTQESIDHTMKTTNNLDKVQILNTDGMKETCECFLLFIYKNKVEIR